jgi:exodeoxyribonuclease V alpha subunit
VRRAGGGLMLKAAGVYSERASKPGRAPPGGRGLTYERLVELGVVCDSDPEAVRSLYRGRDGTTADLLPLDFLTIRDLAREGDDAGDHRVHALLLSLMVARDAGSVGLRVDTPSVAAALATFLPDGHAANLADDVVRWWHAAAFQCRLVSTVDGNAGVAPLTGDRYRPVVRCDGRAYFHRYYVNQRSLGLALASRLSRPGGPDAGGDAGGDVAADDALRVHLRQVIRDNPLRRDGRPVELNTDQKVAVALAALRRLVVISGGPGTGKTSIVFTLLRVLIRLGVAADRVRLAAPTGRAARRITESMTAGLAGLADRSHPADAALSLLAGTTLHRLLEYDVGRDAFRASAANPLQADVVVVDEVSMVDVVLMARLLDAVPPTARLILLGDKDQLPSVEAGTVLADLLPPAARTNLTPPTRKRLERVLEEELDEGDDVAPADPAAGAGSSSGAAHPPAASPQVVPADSVVVLRRNYRSQLHIQAVAARVNAGDATVVGELPTLDLSDGGGRAAWPRLAELGRPGGPKGGGCWLLRAADRRQWERVLAAWAARHFLGTGDDDGPDSYASLVRRCATLSAEELSGSAPLEELSNRLERFRVLTLARDGPYGCDWVNAFLADRLRRALDRQGRGRHFAGAPVMISRNDHGRQVYNGDVGVFVRDRSGGLHAAFRGPGGFVTYAPDTLPAHEPAFATTVHKGQGSEYGQVLLSLPPGADHRLLGKEIVYTGITRAKSFVAVHAAPEVLAAAIRRPTARQGGLGGFAGGSGAVVAAGGTCNGG